MNYADIKKIDVANGEGVRVSLFVSGCNHHCKGCFNQCAWDFNYGNKFTEKEEQKIIEYMDHDYIEGLSLLGGEPLEPKNQEGLLPLVKDIKEKFPDKNIWCYTGFDFEKDIIGKMAPKSEITRELLKYIDLLRQYKQGDAESNIGCIVMNCNPFTLGHRYLIEYASLRVDYLEKWKDSRKSVKIKICIKV